MYEENENILLGLHTQAAGLQGRYEETVRKARQLEFLIARIRYIARERYEDFSTAKNAIWNLYNLMCIKKGVPTRIRKNDLEQQLIYISKTLQLLQLMTEKYKWKY